MTDHLSAEAARLAAIANDLEERLAALQARAEAAAELSVPGPTARDLGAARRLAKAARAAADGAARHAGRKTRRAS